MSAIRTLLLLLIAVILAGFIGFAVDQFVILYAHVQPISAQCLGIAVWAASLLVLIAVMGLQAKDYR